MNIAVIGYGKMGREIEKVALSKHFNISHIIDIHNISDFDKINKDNTDVAVEFTSPATVIDNIKKCFKKQIPVVTGTTGWYSKLPEIEDILKKLNGTLFYSPNFSLGANFFLKFCGLLSKTLNEKTGYEIVIEETHHKEKLDSPSGTAVSAAGIILDNCKYKTHWVSRDSGIPSELPVISHRVNNVTGIHKVVFSSPSDIIELSHSAGNRTGFALGAIKAAEFIKNKKGIFNMSDLMNLNYYE